MTDELRPAGIPRPSISYTALVDTAEMLVDLRIRSARVADAAGIHGLVKPVLAGKARKRRPCV